MIFLGFDHTAWGHSFWHDAAVAHDLEERIRSSFARQGLTGTLGATIDAVSGIADSAAGYAALTLMPPGPRP